MTMTMTIEKERLLRLAVLLENWDQRKSSRINSFNLFTWVQEQDCGTVVCAVGAAMYDPWFREQGLTTTSEAYMPFYQGYTNWRAVQAFFGLTVDQAYTLFLLDNYRNVEMLGTAGRKAMGETIPPTEVAERIRAFIGVPRHPENPDLGEALPMPTFAETNERPVALTT